MPVQTNSSDLVVHRLEYDEIEIIYPELFKEIFNHIDPAHIPGFVYVGKLKGEYVGFLAAYRHKADTIYLQYGGFIESYRGFQAVKLLRQVIEMLHLEFQFIIVHVENTNIAALKLFMAEGFRIIGTHSATNHTIFVELLRRKDYGIA